MSERGAKIGRGGKERECPILRTNLNALGKKDRNNQSIHHRERPPGKCLDNRARGSITGFSFFSPRHFVPQPLARVHRASLRQKVGGDDGGGHLGTKGREIKRRKGGELVCVLVWFILIFIFVRSLSSLKRPCSRVARLRTSCQPWRGNRRRRWRRPSWH